MRLFRSTKRFKRVLLTIAGFFLGAFLARPGAAQQHLLDQYSLEEGLPEAQVQDAVQGPRGYLWVGLYGGGAARFDGQQFKIFTIDDGLPSNTVTALHATSSSVLWMGTTEGLARYDGTTIQAFTTENSAVPHNRVHDIVEGSDGTVWIGTPEGVAAYDGSSVQPLAADQLEGTYEKSLAARDDTLWIGASDGLYRYTDSALTAVPLPKAVSGEAVMTLSTGKNGRLWVETGAGLFEYQDGQYKQLPGTANLDVRTVRDAPNGPLWIGAWDGLYRRDEQGLQRFPGKLGRSEVLNIFADREQNVWFCTNGRGLFKYTRTPFDRFTTGDGLPDPVVWDIAGGPSGDLWIATGGGLSRYDGTSFSDVTGAGGRLQKEVASLHWTQAGHLWIGGQSLLLRYDGSAYRSYDDVIGDRFVGDIAATPSGAVWFATLTDGVLRYDDAGFTRYTTEDGLLSNQVRSLTVGPEGQVWGGEGGSRFGGERFHPTPAVRNSGISMMAAFEVDSSGALWMGTQQGLYMRPAPDASGADSLVHFTSEDGLKGINVVLLLLDREGSLWAGTEEGLNRLDVETYKQTGTMPIRSYTRENGLFRGMAAQHASFVGKSGTLWFGTSKGLVRYNPIEERPRIGPPRPHVIDVGLFAETVDWDKYAEGFTPWEHLPISLTLPPDKNHLVFRYVGLNYTSPDQVQYRYRLRGFNERWSKPTKQRQATYSNLPPGSYTFQVKASKGEGQWSSRTATYSFTIERPFWQATWFYALCGLGGVGLLVGVVFGTVRWRTRRLKKEKEMLEKQLSRRSKEVEERWS